MRVVNLLLRLQLDEAERDGETEERQRHADVGHADGGCLGHSIGLACYLCHVVQAFGCDGLCAFEDEHGAEEGRDEGADGVECLGEVESA